MAGDPYCGNCHTWTRPRATNFGQIVDWTCDCPIDKVDNSKDPNCHNSNHAHHDPQSPIVLGRRAIDEADDLAYIRAKEEREAARETFEETRAELDAILREANKQVED